MTDGEPQTESQNITRDSLDKVGEYKLADREAVLTLWQTPDKLGAYISFDRKRNAFGTRVGRYLESETISEIKDITRILRDEEGLDPELDRLESIRGELVAALEGNLDSNLRLVARGREPTDGRDAYFELAESLQNLFEETEIEILREDTFHSYEGNRMIDEGACIGIYHPPTPGRDGIDIYGRALPAEDGAELEIAPGDNVEYDPETREFLATHEGLVDFGGGALEVKPIYEVKGNLGHDTGEVDFVGSVRVTGDVLDGTKASAERDIEVGGVVEAALLTAGEHIAITGGVAGKGDGIIRAGGRLSAKYVSDCDIEAGGDIQIDKAIKNCDVKTTGKIDIEGGRIVGGQTIARDSICVGTLGSPMGIDTVAVAGYDYDIDRRIAELQDHLEAIDSEILQLENRIDLAEGPDEESDFDSDRVEEQKRRLDSLQRERRETERWLEALKEDLYCSKSDAPVIAVTQKLHPNVAVQIGRNTRIVERGRTGPLEIRISKASNKIEFFSD